MKKLITLLALAALGAASQAEAAIVLAHVNVSHNIGQTNILTNFPLTVATGSVVGVFVSSPSTATVAPSAVTDTNSDTLITSVAWTCPASSEGCVGVYLFVVGTGGTSFGIRVQFAASTNFTMTLFNYTGVNATPVDGSPSAVAHSGTGTTATTASLTPSQSGDMQLAFVLASSTIGAWGNSLTQQEGFLTGTGPQAYADLLLASTSAVTASVAQGSTGPWDIVQLLLAPAGGGGGCTNTGWTSAGAFSVPTASVTSVWLKTGAFGTTDCSATQYWQASGAFGAN